MAFDFDATALIILAMLSLGGHRPGVCTVNQDSPGRRWGVRR
ncbi:hypothetical protein ACFYW6_25830 [Streptomyces sp. NPDC002659]